ncbi:MAG TPA: cysteine synthase A [Acidobacteriaceae bacterium]|nr:cysteine synthase A [Acidobacteriaceae bacterium]
MPSHEARIAADTTRLVGNTPMVHLGRISPAGGADVYVKLEFLNPGGSIKDRAALGMILDAEEHGLLLPGGTVIEATAGNTGVGLAFIGVHRGYRVVLFVPEGFAEEKCILMRGFGATVIRTPEAEAMSGAIRRAKDLAAATPDAWMAMQFENPANPDFHARTTAQEILDQMEGRIDAFVVGVGSGGTFTGVARRLKSELAAVWTIAVEPEGSVLQGGAPGHHKVEGIGASFVPKTFDRSVCDEIVKVTDEDAFRMVQRLATEEGLLGGSSSGANVFAAVERARTMHPGESVVTIIPDSAERYLSKKIFEGGI